MVRAYIRREQYERSLRANEVCALIIGYREKRPNLRKLHRQLTGRKSVDYRDETTKRILAHSRKRAEKKNAPKGEPRDR